jgi:hypothetical protein
MSIQESQDGKMQNSINLAKGQLAVDINTNVDDTTALNKFINSMTSVGVTDVDSIIMGCFNVVYSLGKSSNIFSELMKIYPDKAEDISKFSIIFFKKYATSGDDVMAKIKDFYAKYGETKEMLLTELGFLIADGFKDIDRITYITNKCNTTTTN